MQASHVTFTLSHPCSFHSHSASCAVLKIHLVLYGTRRVEPDGKGHVPVLLRPDRESLPVYCGVAGVRWLGVAVAAPRRVLRPAYWVSHPFYAHSCGVHCWARNEDVVHSRSKSSSLSRYFMIFRLIFEESTQVTKSSMFLPRC